MKAQLDFYLGLRAREEVCFKILVQFYYEIYFPSLNSRSSDVNLNISLPLSLLCFVILCAPV
jgi:hypothetical protein